MLITELEKLAMKGANLPDGITPEEQLLFLQLKYLYILHRSGKLTQEQGKAEKAKLISEYNNRVAQISKDKLMQTVREHIGQTMTFNGIEYKLTAIICRGTIYQAELTDKCNRSVCIVRLEDIEIKE